MREALRWLPPSLFVFSVTPGKRPFGAPPAGSLWSSQVGTHLQDCGGGPPLTHPAGMSHSSGPRGSLSWGPCGLRCLGVCRGETGLIRCGARSRLVPTAFGCPPEVRPPDPSLLVPEMLGGFLHSAGGGSLALCLPPTPKCPARSQASL